MDHSGHLLGTVVHYSEGNSRVNVVSVMGPVQVNISFFYKSKVISTSCLISGYELLGMV